MTIVFALIRKNILESRWMLLLIGTTLFWLCWLFVFVTRKIETDPRRGMRLPVSSIELEMQFWERMPLFYLFVCLWAITRGTSVAGEIERGTMDLVMSRPVRRSTYLSSHVIVSALGFVMIGAAMLAGNQWSAHYNILKEPPSVATLLKPTLNFLALGFAVYGYTFLVSTFDIVRWRPNLIASTVTLAAYIAHVIANTPMVAEDWKWIDKLSIFRACRFVEVATTGETLAFNASLLGGIGLTGVVIGFLAFSFRDLPAGS